MVEAVRDGAGEEAREGLVIAGRYRLVRRLGAGGFGQVWQATDTTLHVDVAVKRVWLEPSMTPAQTGERLARAQREARSAARLRDHPHVVAVHDVVVADGVPWMVMQLVSGSSLADRLAAGGPLEPAEAARIGSAMLSALGAAHAAGIVHRDVKPANIMITGDGQVLLADFGIALRSEETALTVSGAVIGSVEYMAPERIRGEEDGPAGDLFSLGVTLYQAVEGRSPFQRGTPTASLLAVVSDEVPPPSRAGALAPVIAGLMAKNPQQRLTLDAAAALLGRTAAAPGPGPLDAAPVAAPVPVPAAVPASVPVPVPAPAQGWDGGSTGVIDAYAGLATSVSVPAPPAASAPSAPVDVPATSGSAAPATSEADVPAPAGRARWPWVVIAVSLVVIVAGVAAAIAVPYFSPAREIRAKLLHKSDLPAGYVENVGAGDMGYGRPAAGSWPCEARNREVKWKHTWDDTAEFSRSGSGGSAVSHEFNEGLRKADDATIARSMQAVRDQIANCASFTADIKFGSDSQSCVVTINALPAPAIGGDVVARRETYTCTENGTTYAPAVVDKVTTAKGGYLVEFFASDRSPFPPTGVAEDLMRKALAKLP
ncbi:serine/threonine-protein kinase [Kitasatospora sp. NPDC047058]|uniref:serine/threonine-protein kinase n=1 Tax=Kitasatospora sp. NPDC047058 TaxID=3155620 RepID=UPI0033D195D1